MSTITLRAVKGSPLTNTEVDTNFSNLNTDKLEATYSGAMNSLTGGSSITTVSSTTGITTGAWKASVIAPAYGGTGVANNAANTITFTGAYSLGLTLTGATSVTMPTSGTLATLSGVESLINKSIGSGSTWTGNVIAPNYGGTGVANNVASTITITGAYALGLTLTAGTSVTLPTSGTLATLAGSEALTNKTYNALTLTAAATGFTIAGGTTSKTLTMSNTLTFTGTDSSSVAFGTGGTVAYTNVTTLSSLASIGTITTGTWNGSIIGLAYGGTNANITAAAGAVVYSTASALGVTSAGTSGQLLQSNGTSAPSWVTPTYATTGKAIAMAMVFGG